MDHSASRERELEVDLESGGTTSEEDGTKDLVSTNRQPNGIFDWVWTRRFSIGDSINGKCGMNSYSNSSKFGEAVNENEELLLDKSSEDENKENATLLEKKSVEGKRKKNNCRKPPKPPRPPNGPSLDAADQKLVKEIAELAMRKRARIERIKALKKMKVAKSSTSFSNLSAMLITLLFCLIIIFQGLFSGSSRSVNMNGSPAPAVTARESLISVQLYKSFSANERDGPGSSSIKLAGGQVPASGSGKEPNKADK